jgi:hypothetical protein
MSKFLYTLLGLLCLNTLLVAQTASSNSQPIRPTARVRQLPDYPSNSKSTIAKKSTVVKDTISTRKIASAQVVTNQIAKAATEIKATKSASIPAAINAKDSLKKANEALENKAEISFSKDTHDFGTINEGPVVNYEFNYMNTGKEPLILENVHASCGCTTPDWSTKAVLPGESGVIKVSYNTQGRIGGFNKTIFIKSNAKTVNKELYILGTVIATKIDPTNATKQEIDLQQKK